MGRRACQWTDRSVGDLFVGNALELENFLWRRPCGRGFRAENSSRTTGGSPAPRKILKLLGGRACERAALTDDAFAEAGPTNPIAYFDGLCGGRNSFLISRSLVSHYVLVSSTQGFPPSFFGAGLLMGAIGTYNAGDEIGATGAGFSGGSGRSGCSTAPLARSSITACNSAV